MLPFVDGEDLEDVIAVGGELMLRHQAAAGAERQTFDVIVLRGVFRHAVGGLGGRSVTSPIARRLIFAGGR